jgi:DNA polymerase-3 subunit delta'
MTGIDEIIGQQNALEIIRRMCETGRVPHGLLFQGPEGCGKACVALALASQLLCEESDGPCGRCESCRLIVTGGHPDLLTVHRMPKKPTASATVAPPGDPEDLRQFIVVDQVRELTRVAGMAPRRGARRVFIIEPADRMNNEAQNALLKTLEEPPGRTVLILVASRPHLLLPTVRSRCFVVGFAALRVGELAAALVKRGFDTVEAATRAALAEGRPGRALDLDLGQLQERRDQLLRCLESLATRPSALAELPAMAGDIAGKTQSHLLDSLDLLEALLRDAARAGQHADDPGLVHADLATRLRALGRQLGPERAAELVGCVERLRRDLRLNVNRTLVAEALLAAVAGGPVP